MSNQHPTKDMIGASPCNLADNDIQSKAKLHQLHFWLKQLCLAYEGYFRSSSYANANIDERLRNEGKIQQNKYCALFCEAMDALCLLQKEIDVVLMSNEEVW